MTKGRVDELDGVRALAVLAVLAFHLAPRQMRGGFLGVDVFFVLSGFLITSILAREWRTRSRVDIAAFYARRALRLYPALIVLVVLTVALVPVAADFPVRQTAIDAGWSITYLFDVHIVGIGRGSPLSHTWSLAVEEQFYLVWPLILILLLRIRRPLVGTAGVTLALVALPMILSAAGHDDLLTFTPLGHAGELLVGACLALAAPRVSAWSGWAGLALLAAAAFTVRQDSVWLFRGGLLVLSLVSCAVIASAPAIRMLAWRPLVWIGQRSYGVYLYHFLAIWLCSRLPGPTPLHDLAVVSIAGALTVASWELVERPALALKQRFERAPSGGLADRVDLVEHQPAKARHRTG